MRDELGAALEVVARAVTIRIEAPSDVQVGVLGPYLVARHGGAIEVAVPDLVSGQVLELVLHVVVPQRAPGDRVALTARSNALAAAGVTVNLRAVEATALRAQRGDRDVIGLVSHRIAAAARERAAMMNHAGTYQRAADELAEAARRLRSYIAIDPALLRIIADLEADAEVVARRMDRAGEAVDVRRRVVGDPQPPARRRLVASSGLTSLMTRSLLVASGTRSTRSSTGLLTSPTTRSLLVARWWRAWRSPTTSRATAGRGGSISGRASCPHRQRGSSRRQRSAPAIGAARPVGSRLLRGESTRVRCSPFRALPSR